MKIKNLKKNISLIQEISKLWFPDQNLYDLDKKMCIWNRELWLSGSNMDISDT